MKNSFLDKFLDMICSSLRIPVIILLAILLLVTVFIIGSFIVEIVTEHRKLKINMPNTMNLLKENNGNIEDIKEIVKGSNILNVQKESLITILDNADFSKEMKESLAIRLIDEQKSTFYKRTKITDIIAKIGPMLGLLGTLIPLGPGIVSLGQGDTFMLSQSLQTAFNTTIVGLVCAGICMIISIVRKGWYANYMSIYETLTETILEVSEYEKKN